MAEECLSGYLEALRATGRPLPPPEPATPSAAPRPSRSRSPGITRQLPALMPRQPVCVPVHPGNLKCSVLRSNPSARPNSRRRPPRPLDLLSGTPCTTPPAWERAMVKDLP